MDLDGAMTFLLICQLGLPLWFYLGYKLAEYTDKK